MSLKQSQLISAEYKALNQKLHETSAEYGTSGYKWARKVADLCERFRAASILDYGCGKRVLERGLREVWADVPVIDVHNYDPCVPGFEAKTVCDIVSCIDVLEHIEPDRLDAVLEDIGEHFTKSAFLLVATRPAKKHLADGRNAHLIQRPYSWWLQKLMARFELLAFENHERKQFIAVIAHAPTTASQPAAAQLARTGTTG